MTLCPDCGHPMERHIKSLVRFKVYPWDQDKWITRCHEMECLMKFDDKPKCTKIELVPVLVEEKKIKVVPFPQNKIERGARMDD